MGNEKEPQTKYECGKDLRWVLGGKEEGEGKIINWFFSSPVFYYVVCPTAKAGCMHKQLIRHQKKRILWYSIIWGPAELLSVCDSETTNIFMWLVEGG